MRTELDSARRTRSNSLSEQANRFLSALSKRYEGDEEVFKGSMSDLGEISGNRKVGGKERIAGNQ